ncbi:unnamed protein product [Zymoseptoria tritici ST99CH_1A5]|uniref:Uncharacterized protein n=1 Tax=Zymoseptoria tritici ST99CH_1A5 TaxID=1276529 RepID=A0A1Y6M1F4_ZYMTR|nr:unnamed protein product [Zymoseptoria tritici ST99CH_1A5]
MSPVNALSTSGVDMDKDECRMYENCSYADVLDGKKMCFSPTWVRAALAWCAKKQISAHCLPQNTKELVEFMNAIGWKVADPDLFRVLSKKLLTWVTRWITNKHLSPAMIETKKDPTQVRIADWESVWANYTIAWADPSFHFVLGKTSVEPPKGTRTLAPRATVSRAYKPMGALIDAAAEWLTCYGRDMDNASDEELDAGTSVAAEDSELEDSGVELEWEELVEKAVPTTTKVPTTTTKGHLFKVPTTDKVPTAKSHGAQVSITKAPASQAPIANVPSTKVHKPTESTSPAIPVAFFASVIADPHFEDWYHDNDSSALTPGQEAIFQFVEDNEHFKDWYKSELRAKMKAAALEPDTTTAWDQGAADLAALLEKAVKKTKKTPHSAKKTVPVGNKKWKVQFPVSPPGSVVGGRGARRGEVL